MASKHRPLPLLGSQTHNGGIGTARGHHGVGLHLVVVLAPNPTLAGDGGVIEQAQQHLPPGQLARSQNHASTRWHRQGRFLPAPVLLNLGRGGLQEQVMVDGRVVGQGTGRDLGGHLPPLQDPHDVLG